MKKLMRTFLFVTIIFSGTIIFLSNIANYESNISNSIDLESLIKLCNAQAECMPPSDYSPDAKCMMTNDCYLAIGHSDCDPFEY